MRSDTRAKALLRPGCEPPLLWAALCGCCRCLRYYCRRRLASTSRPPSGGCGPWLGVFSQGANLTPMEFVSKKQKNKQKHKSQRAKKNNKKNKVQMHTVSVDAQIQAEFKKEKTKKRNEGHCAKKNGNLIPKVGWFGCWLGVLAGCAAAADASDSASLLTDLTSNHQYATGPLWAPPGLGSFNMVLANAMGRTICLRGASSKPCAQLQRMSMR